MVIFVFVFFKYVLKYLILFFEQQPKFAPKTAPPKKR